MTLESARNSILSALKLEGIIDQTFFDANTRRNTKQTYVDPLLDDLSYYQEGFRIFEIENSVNHYEDTLFLYTSRRMTPEKLLCFLAQHCLVIALSATAKWDTGDNFDLHYCREVLGDKYYDLNTILKDELVRDRKKMESFYQDEKIQLHVKSLNGKASFAKFNNDMEALLQKTFPQDGNRYLVLAEKMHNDVCRAAAHNSNSKRKENDDSQEYFYGRYIELFGPIYRFIHTPSAKAWLFLNTATLGTNPGFSSAIVDDYISLCKRNVQNAGSDISVYILSSKKDFKATVDDIWKDLGNGKRVMVFAAYQTIATGQNLQYLVSGKERNRSVCIRPDAETPSDPRFYKRDFDGIVLGEMTYLSWRPSVETKHPKLDILTGISEYEVMMERNVMSQKKGRERIRTILKDRFELLNRQNEINILIRRRAMRQLIQATGRISRTFLKLPHIYIYISDSVLQYVDRDEMLKHELTYEQRIIAENAYQVYGELKHDQEAELTNAAERISNMANRLIRRRLASAALYGWTEERIRVWKLLRECALKYPTFDEIPKEFREIAKKFYFRKPMEHAPQYYYFARNNYSTVLVSFADSKRTFLRMREDELPQEGSDEEVIIQEMSEEASRLDKMLLFPDFKQYMEAHGYATSFQNGRFVMAPAFFNNIYKGALGEAFGDFIFQKLGYPIKEIENPDFFELFDFIWNNCCYIDLKNWSEQFQQKDEEQQEKIHRKLQKTGGTAMIVNIMDTEGHLPDLSADGKVLTIPGIIDDKGKLLQKNIHRMRDFFYRAEHSPMKGDDHYGLSDKQS